MKTIRTQKPHAFALLLTIEDARLVRDAVRAFGLRNTMVGDGNYCAVRNASTERLAQAIGEALRVRPAAQEGSTTTSQPDGDPEVL